MKPFLESHFCFTSGKPLDSFVVWKSYSHSDCLERLQLKRIYICLTLALNTTVLLDAAPVEGL